MKTGILNVYETNRAAKYSKQKLIELKGVRAESIIIVGDLAPLCQQLMEKFKNQEGCRTQQHH